MIKSKVEKLIGMELFLESCGLYNKTSANEIYFVLMPFVIKVGLGVNDNSGLEVLGLLQQLA